MIGTPKLHEAKPDYAVEVPQQKSLSSGVPHVIDHVCGEQPEEIQDVKMLLWEDVLKGHGFAAVAIVYRIWSLVVNMNDLRISNVRDRKADFHDAVCPAQVFQSWQCLVIRKRLPERTAYGSIGIVAEGVRLTWL